jgi:hypothetical protein
MTGVMSGKVAAIIVTIITMIKSRPRPESGAASLAA